MLNLKVFFKELNKHAPLKKKILRHNNNAFMTKELRKEIMLRSKLKNEFNKERNHINWCNYKRQLNHCLKELRNRIIRSILVWSLFCLIRLYVGMHFLRFLLEN